MTITPRVREQMFQRATAAGAANTTRSRTLIRIPLSRQQLIMPIDPADTPLTGSFPRASAFGSAWTPAEHERFLEALELFPSGPWKRVAEYVGTKTARQAMTHAQKYRQKFKRRHRLLEQQAREAQSAGNGSDARPPISTVATEAPATVVSASVTNSGDLQEEIDLTVRGTSTLEEPILESFYNGELSDEGSGDGDINHQLFEELMRNANNMVDEQLLHELAMVLGGEATSPSFLPWSLDEPLFAFGGSDIGSMVFDDFEFVSDVLTRVSHEDIQIWFGESESQR